MIQLKNAQKLSELKPGTYTVVINVTPTDIEIVSTPAQCLQKIDTPSTVVRDDQISGTYLVYKYAETIFRGKPRTILFLEQEDKTTIPCYGYFLQEQLSTMNLKKFKAPMVVEFGKIKTTPMKRKARQVTITSG